MKVLVTGAAGFIGNKVALYFLSKGDTVIGWDRQHSNEGFQINGIDLLDDKLMMDELSIIKPDTVIHCAGLADVAKSVIDPFVDYEGNVTITHNLLFAIHKSGLEKSRFVFLSSAGVYGNPNSLPITENMTLRPLSPYAVHKVMCEELCKYFANNYGMNIKVARIFSAYGAGLKKQIFWDMYQKQRKNGRLDMFGTGFESRDYIHVNDVAQALYLLATTNSPDVVYNVANGEETQIREAVELFANAASISRDCILFNGTVREGDPLNWRADISKIKALGYKKTVNMEDGLAEFYKWAETQE